MGGGGYPHLGIYLLWPNSPLQVLFWSAQKAAWFTSAPHLPRLQEACGLPSDVPAHRDAAHDRRWLPRSSLAAASPYRPLLQLPDDDPTH